MTSTIASSRLEGPVAQNAVFKAEPDPQILASCGEQALVLVTNDVNTVTAASKA